MDVPPVERIIIPQNTRDIRSNVDNSNLSNNEKNNYETNKLEQQSYIKQNNLNNNALYNGKPILTSAMMRKNVTTARQIAQVRFVKQGWNCNAQASGTWLRKYTSKHALMLVNNALEKHQLSLRGADRALRLAWTLADIAGHVSPDVTDMAQAISLRTRI